MEENEKSRGKSHYERSAVTSIDDCYEELFAAIFRQAADDYVLARLTGHKTETKKYKAAKALCVRWDAYRPKYSKLSYMSDSEFGAQILWAVFTKLLSEMHKAFAEASQEASFKRAEATAYHAMKVMHRNGFCKTTEIREGIKRLTGYFYHIASDCEGFDTQLDSTLEETEDLLRRVMPQYYEINGNWMMRTLEMRVQFKQNGLSKYGSPIRKRGQKEKPPCTEM